MNIFTLISMNILTKVLLLLVFLLSLSLLGGTVFALVCSQGDLCVNETGWWFDGGDFNSSATPIQSAVDNATLGNAVYVWNGTYNEEIIVDKSLIIEGQSNNDTFIIGGFNIIENNVTLRDFNISSGLSGSYKTGIYLVSDNSNILNNSIHSIYGANGGPSDNGAHAYGIYSSNSQNTTIYMNSIYDIRGGNGGDGYNAAYGNSNGGSGGNVYSIYLLSSKDCNITANVIYSSDGGNGGKGWFYCNFGCSAGSGGGGGYTYGLYVSGDNKSMIDSNEMYLLTGGNGGAAWPANDGYDYYGNGGSGGGGVGVYMTASVLTDIIDNSFFDLFGGNGGSGPTIGCSCGSGKCCGGTGGYGMGAYFASSALSVTFYSDNNISGLTGGDGAAKSGSGGKAYGVYVGTAESNDIATGFYPISYLTESQIQTPGLTYYVYPEQQDAYHITPYSGRVFNVSVYNVQWMTTASFAGNYSLYSMHEDVRGDIELNQTKAQVNCSNDSICNYEWIVPDDGYCYYITINTTATDSGTSPYCICSDFFVMIENQSASFEQSGTDYIDVDNIFINPNINISALVYRELNNSIDDVWINITMPNTTVKKYYLENTTIADETQTWFKILNITQEFSNLLGRYNVTFYVNSTLNGSTITQQIPVPLTEFYIENIAISIDMNKDVYNPEENITVFGHITLQPYDTNVTDNTIHIYLNEMELLYNSTTGLISSDGNELLTTDALGNYNYTVQALMESGTYTLKVNLIDSNGITSQNQTNFTSRIAIRDQHAFLLGSSTKYIAPDYQINISAFVYKNIDNPIDKVWVNITMPNTTVKTYYLENTTISDDTQMWNNTLNVSYEFNNIVGQYNLTFYANSTLLNSSTITQEIPPPTTDFHIVNMTVLVNSDKLFYKIGEDIIISGKVFFSVVTNVTDNLISIWLDEMRLKLRYDGFLTESWGLSGWDYYRSVIIQNTAGSLTDYLVLIQANMSQAYSDGKIEQDCADIRFVADTLSEYTYVVSECNLAEDDIINAWVNITLPNGNTTVYMFYGNPSANDTGTLWDNLWDNVSHLGIYGGLFSYNCSGYGDCFEDYDNPENYTDFYSKMNSNPNYSIDMQHRLGISAGPFTHTCILKSNGSVECYGATYSGFTGYAGGDAIGVTTGVWHMCILKSNGTVECFGQNNDGCANSYNDGDAVMVSTGYDNTCVLKSNGNVTCYGENTYGQSNDYTGGDAIGVFAGGSILTSKGHTCVLKSDGNVECYGNNDYGQSYNYTGGDAIGISLSSMHTCILKSDGNVECYGNNDYGQSYNYTGGDAIGVSITEGHTCILKSNGNVECYGDNVFGQSNNYTGGDAIGVSAGGMLFMGAYTCILKPGSNVECWGTNGQGQSNNYTGNDAKNPFRTYASPEPVSYTGSEQATTTDSDGNYNYTIRESLGDGTYILKVNLTDPNSYYGENQTTFVVDGTLPTITFIDSTTQTGTYSQDYVEANVTATDDNMADVTIYLYNTTGLVQSYTDSTGFFHNFTNLDDETYYLNATVNDTAGNTNQTETRTITIDITNPQIFYNPNTDNDGTYDRNWTFINITASDTNKDTVLFEWNGTNETFDDNDGNYYWENKTGLFDGTYTIKVYVNDTLGHINQTETRTITVDTIPPEIIMLSPENATSIPAGTIQAYIDITTDENATCRYNITDSGYENSTNFTSTGNQDHSFLYTGLSDGNVYDLYYWCNDSYGHINANSTHHTFSVSSQTAYCGDGICNNGETCSTCSSDCGSCSSGGGSHQIPQDDQGEDEDNVTDEDDERDDDEISDLTDDDLNQTLQQDDKDDGNKIEINETVAREYIESVEALLSGLRGKGYNVIDEADEMITLAWQALEDGSYEEAYDLARKAENMLIEQDTGIAGDDTLTGYIGLFPAAFVLLLIALLAFGAYMWLKRRDAAVSEPDDTLDLKSLVERMAVIERDEQEISHKLDVVKNLISGLMNYLKRKK